MSPPGIPGTVALPSLKEYPITELAPCINARSIGSVGYGRPDNGDNFVHFRKLLTSNRGGGYNNAGRH